MPSSRSAARALVRSLRPVIESHHERHGRQGGRATITYLHGEPAARTFTAELHGTGLVLSDHNTTFAQAVVEYDLHSGLAVGDTLIVIELDEDDWTAIAVESDTDSTGAATPAEVAAAAATAHSEVLAIKPELRTTLPASPKDEQVIDYLANATTGVIWRLRYRAASSSAHKWEYVGGSDLEEHDFTDARNPTASFTAFNTTSVGSSIAMTLALAGDYDLYLSAGIVARTASAVQLRFFPATNALAALGGVDVLATINSQPGSSGVSYFQQAYSGRVTEVTAGTVVIPAFQASLSLYEASFYGITMRAHPIRVG